MRKLPSILLLDTNIWLDNYLGNRRFTDASRNLLATCAKRNITVAYAASSVKDVFYIIAAQMKHFICDQKGAVTDSEALACNETAWSCIRNMSALGVAATVAEPQIALALNYKGFDRDFEDDVVIAAMETSKADFLVTNDESLLTKCPFPALSSPDMLALLNAS